MLRRVGSPSAAARAARSAAWARNRFAGFAVLKSPDVPSVLLELGYVSTKDDLKQLLSQSWRERTSAAAVKAISSSK